jgi:hypothetical protein
MLDSESTSQPLVKVVTVAVPVRVTAAVDVVHRVTVALLNEAATHVV